MDFNMIRNNVYKYLDKQQASMQANTHLINVTIRKLDQYIDSFHFEMKEMLEAERISMPEGHIGRIKRPSLQPIQPEQLNDSDKIKKKLTALSDQLLAELAAREQSLTSFFVTGDTIDKFWYYIQRTFEHRLDFDYKETSLRYEVLHRIIFEIRHWNGEQSCAVLKHYFRDITNSRVIEELCGTGSRDSVEFKGHDTVSQYREYFEACLRAYEQLYTSGELNMNDDKALLPLIEEPIRQAGSPVIRAEVQLSQSSNETVPIQQLKKLIVELDHGERCVINLAQSSEQFQRELLQLLEESRSAKPPRVR